MLTEIISNKTVTRGAVTVGLAAALSLGAAGVYAQTSTTHSLSVSQQELRMAERGWSAKKDIMGKAVYNDNNDKIGNVDDVVFPRSNKSEQSFAIIGVGGFLGLGKHDVAVPISHLKYETDKLILPGATKDALKAMPDFQYTNVERKDNSRTSSR